MAIQEFNTADEIYKLCKCLQDGVSNDFFECYSEGELFFIRPLQDEYYLRIESTEARESFLALVLKHHCDGWDDLEAWYQLYNTVYNNVKEVEKKEMKWEQ